MRSAAWCTITLNKVSSDDKDDDVDGDKDDNGDADNDDENDDNSDKCGTSDEYRHSWPQIVIAKLKNPPNEDNLSSSSSRLSPSSLLSIIILHRQASYCGRVQ